MSNHAACSYQDFHPETLLARSPETERRLSDLAPVMKVVADKTVLDIGCNGGLVSALALRSRAHSVLATDVNPAFVEATRKVLEHQAGIWDARVLSARDLGPGERAQVTFFLEVYHWLIHQGMTAEEVAEILDSVTSETIILEAPWDARDPSVAASLKGIEYGLPPLLRALLRREFNIELLGFATYFPPEYERPLFLCSRTPRALRQAVS